MGYPASTLAATQQILVLVVPLNTSSSSDKAFKDTGTVQRSSYLMFGSCATLRAAGHGLGTGTRVAAGAPAVVVRRLDELGSKILPASQK